MKKNILSISILVFGILISGAIIGLAHAQTTTPGDIQYPISELGNCKNKDDCKVFCDDSKNVDACLSFAKQNNLMTSGEISNAKKFQDQGMVGPGGCKGQTACEQYCGTSTHIEECTAFAEKNGMMTDQQLQDSKKVVAAIKSGLKPPACAGPEKCKAYCSNPLHMEECMTFSLAAGVVPDEQKAQMQKTLEALKKGAKPPACQPNPPSDQLGQTADQPNNGLQPCDEYCDTHMEECMSFSIATGMVPEDQKAQMQKTLDAFKQGIKPPACRPNPPDQSGQPGQPTQPGQKNQNKTNQSKQGLQACDEYCADSSHVEECVKFSVAMGNMTEKQAQSAIKNGNKGPGGCIGKDACDTFCNNPDNQDTCFNFAKDNGMIPEEDLQKMQDGQQKMKDTFSSIPPEVLDCLTSTVGADVVEKMKTGSVVGRKYGDSINQCFQKSGVREGTPNGNGPGSGQDGQSGQNQNNQGEQNKQGQPMNKFQPGPGNINPGGQQMPQQAGPGGCKGPEECQKYCASNPEECKNFKPQQNQPGQMQPQQQFNQNGEPGQNQPGQPNQLNQPYQLNQINQPGQQPGQMQIEQQQQQPQEQQNLPPLPPSPPSSFLQGVQSLLANVISAFR